MIYGQTLTQLEEIFMMIPEIAFAILSGMNVADLLHLPPIRRKLTFSQFSDKDSMEHLLVLKFWHLFKYAELTEVVKQNDKLFTDLFNKVRIDNIDDDVKNLLEAIFIRESDENYPKDAFHMYAENEPAMKKNKAVLNNLLCPIYTIETNDKIPDNCKYTLALTQAAQNQKQTNTRDLAKLLKLKIVQK